MPLSRPSAALRYKTNVRAVGNRENEATAEDFQELGDLLEEYAEAIEAMQGSQDPNPNYGTFTSLLLLQATYPVGELNAFAIIDPGVGSEPRIALWDDGDAEWVLQNTTSTTTLSQIVQGTHVTDILVTDINDDEYIIVSGTFEGTDPTKLEDYSKNSIIRQL